tara:strand:+ start:481 stop:1017 length:537 start_codon:yes stop_codon:yes gene_type:complete
MKNLFYLTIVFPLLMSCGGGEEPVKEEQAESAPKSEGKVEVVEEPAKPKVKRDFLPNEVIETETGLSVTFLEIAEDTKLGYYDKAEEGMLIRSVKVQIINNTEEALTVSPYDFKLSDNNGKDYSQDFTQGKEPIISQNEIRPGKKLVGYIEFEQSPVDAEGWEITYSPKGESFYIDFE